MGSRGMVIMEQLTSSMKTWPVRGCQGRNGRQRILVVEKIDRMWLGLERT